MIEGSELKALSPAKVRGGSAARSISRDRGVLRKSRMGRLKSSVFLMERAPIMASISPVSAMVRSFSSAPEAPPPSAWAW